MYCFGEAAGVFEFNFGLGSYILSDFRAAQAKEFIPLQVVKAFKWINTLDEKTEELKLNANVLSGKS